MRNHEQSAEPERTFQKLTRISCDLCPQCFQEQFIPALEEMGATIQTKEVDY